MKHLILLRHAKSVSIIEAMSDYKRPLSDKGRNDVNRVGNAFKKIDIQPDIVLCSKAFRTSETLELFKPYLPGDIQIVHLEELYHASASTILDIINEYGSYNNIMVVGHNFGISDFAAMMSGEGAGEMNTCGLYILKFKAGFIPEKGKILHYISPKNI